MTRAEQLTVRRMSSGRAHKGHVRVLVVEDRVALANPIGEGLRDAGFAVDVVYDGAAALEGTASTDYDVVVRQAQDRLKAGPEWKGADDYVFRTAWASRSTPTPSRRS